MNQYIKNLTDHLIHKNGYKDAIERTTRAEFVQYVKTHLWVGDVKEMSPKTLGKIMCSFEVGQVQASKEELFASVHFGGNCDDLFRDLVSICLAYVIDDRLNPHS